MASGLLQFHFQTPIVTTSEHDLSTKEVPMTLKRSRSIPSLSSFNLTKSCTFAIKTYHPHGCVNPKLSIFGAQPQRTTPQNHRSDQCTRADLPAVSSCASLPADMSSIPAPVPTIATPLLEQAWEEKERHVVKALDRRSRDTVAGDSAVAIDAESPSRPLPPSPKEKAWWEKTKRSSRIPRPSSTGSASPRSYICERQTQGSPTLGKRSMIPTSRRSSGQNGQCVVRQSSEMSRGSQLLSDGPVPQPTPFSLSQSTRIVGFQAFVTRSCSTTSASEDSVGSSAASIHAEVVSPCASNVASIQDVAQGELSDFSYDGKSENEFTHRPTIRPGSTHSSREQLTNSTDQSDNEGMHQNRGQFEGFLGDSDQAGELHSHFADESRISEYKKLTYIRRRARKVGGKVRRLKSTIKRLCCLPFNSRPPQVRPAAVRRSLTVTSESEHRACVDKRFSISSQIQQFKSSLDAAFGSKVPDVRLGPSKLPLPSASCNNQTGHSGRKYRFRFGTVSSSMPHALEAAIQTRPEKTRCDAKRERILSLPNLEQEVETMDPSSNKGMPWLPSNNAISTVSPSRTSLSLRLRRKLSSRGKGSEQPMTVKEMLRGDGKHNYKPEVYHLTGYPITQNVIPASPSLPDVEFPHSSLILLESSPVDHHPSFPNEGPSSIVNSKDATPPTVTGVPSISPSDAAPQHLVAIETLAPEISASKALPPSQEFDSTETIQLVQPPIPEIAISAPFELQDQQAVPQGNAFGERPVTLMTSGLLRRLSDDLSGSSVLRRASLRSQVRTFHFTNPIVASQSLQHIRPRAMFKALSGEPVDQSLPEFVASSNLSAAENDIRRIKKLRQTAIKKVNDIRELKEQCIAFEGEFEAEEAWLGANKLLREACQRWKQAETDLVLERQRVVLQQLQEKKTQGKEGAGRLSDASDEYNLWRASQRTLVDRDRIYEDLDGVAAAVNKLEADANRSDHIIRQRRKDRELAAVGISANRDTKMPLTWSKSLPSRLSRSVESTTMQPKRLSLPLSIATEGTGSGMSSRRRESDLLLADVKRRTQMLKARASRLVEELRYSKMPDSSPQRDKSLRSRGLRVVNPDSSDSEDSRSTIVSNPSTSILYPQQLSSDGGTCIGSSAPFPRESIPGVARRQPSMSGVVTTGIIPRLSRLPRRTALPQEWMKDERSHCEKTVPVAASDEDSTDLSDTDSFKTASQVLA